MNDDRLIYYLAINQLNFLKKWEKVLLCDTVDGIREFEYLEKEDLQLIIGRSIDISSFDPAIYYNEAVATYKKMHASGIEAVYQWDDGYPPQLREIYDPPFLLFFRGVLPSGDLPSAGVVGTRKPSLSAKQAAFSLGLDFARAEVHVISGLALGIDADAHKGCLAGGGRTTAVLGNGLLQVYPKTNRSLYESIIENGGCLLSEYAPSTPAFKHHFPERNRIIAGLSRSVVVVQAPKRSGALITAEYALDQGRDVFVHCDGLQGPESEGTASLHLQGAQIINNANDVLADWSIKTVSTHTAVDSVPVTGTKLAQLMELELEGSVVKYLGKYYRSM